MSRRASPRAIGAFVIVAVGLAVAAIAVFGSGRLFRNTRVFVSFFESQVGGLGPGSPVKYRGVTVGSVEGVFIRLAEVPQAVDDVSIPVLYHIDADLIAGRGATLDLDNPAALDSLIDQGFVARLATESLVTGRQYIDLDMEPGREHRFVGTGSSGLYEIPTARTGLEGIQSDLQDVISDVSDLDLTGLFEDIREVVVAVREQVEQGDISDLGGRLASSIDGLDATLADIRGFIAIADSALSPVAGNVNESVEVLRSAADQFEGTMATMRESVGPNGRLVYRLDVALRDLADAARSFRNLADYLERNPSALVRGRPDNQE